MLREEDEWKWDIELAEMVDEEAEKSIKNYYKRLLKTGTKEEIEAFRKEFIGE